MSESGDQGFQEQAGELVTVRAPLIWVLTWEEARLEDRLQQLSETAFSQSVPFLVWSCTDGLVDRGDGQTVAGTDDVVAALDFAMRFEHTAVFLFKDPHPFLRESRVVRKLKDVHESLKQNYKTVFCSSSDVLLPEELQKSFNMLELGLPDLGELRGLFDQVRGHHPDVEVVEGEDVDALLKGAVGLTADEADRAFAKLFMGRKRVSADQLEQLYQEKRGIIRKSAVLDFVPPRARLENIGGLNRLKEWLKLRRTFFTQEARDFGLSEPKGVLVTGISGCGKSLCVQAISEYWELPMVRLDMNRVYGGLLGSPEKALEAAIKTAEAISPCVMWIDEIETAIVGSRGEAGGMTTRIFSSFLTWMQEKTKTVFVAATANEIHMLPPELLRKGRFDEIFFVDLPTEQERSEIFRVHLAKRGKNPTQFPLTNLAKATSNMTGAEIENIVTAALYSAFGQDREVDGDDIYEAIGNTIPLATTMAERIKEIKRWADQRAVKAN